MSISATFDQLLRGGRVICPASGIDGIRDVAIRNGKIAAVQFAAEWRTRVSEQAGLLEEVKAIRSPRVLLRFLAGKTDGPWEALSAEYHALKERLKQAASEAARRYA